MCGFFIGAGCLFVSRPDSCSPGGVGSCVGRAISGSRGGRSGRLGPGIVYVVGRSLSSLDILNSLAAGVRCVPFLRDLARGAVGNGLCIPIVNTNASGARFRFLAKRSARFLPSNDGTCVLCIGGPVTSLISAVRTRGCSS